MNKSSVKIISFASFTLVVCMLLLVTVTYALFTANKTVTNHLTAGNLNIQLVRESGEKKVLDEKGYLKTESLAEQNFTNDSTENIFGIENGEYAVPGAVYQAKMKIVNGKNSEGTDRSTVAFDYEVYLSLTIGEKAEDISLANNLIVTITDENDEVISSGKLSEYQNGIANSKVKILEGIMTKLDVSKSFTIKVEFPSESNNDAQNGKVAFDLYVNAVQKNEEN